MQQRNGYGRPDSAMAGEELYSVLEDLGRGAFGFVRLAVNRCPTARFGVGVH